MYDDFVLDDAPEVRLLGALCLPPGSPSEDPSILADTAAQIVDWPFFLKLASHHRLVPLAAKQFSYLKPVLPVEIAEYFRERTAQNARDAFRYLAELQRLLQLLAASGIRAVVLKGVPLSLLAFGDIATREVGDIDLLIDPSQAERADTVLLESGLVRKEPSGRLTPKRRAIHTKYFKDFTYENAHGFEVDLHWRLVRDSGAAAGLLPHNEPGNFVTLSLASMELRVPITERNLLYLAMHGAAEGWARWKSLADVVALWAKATSAQRASTLAVAGESSTAPCLAAAFLLAEKWFGYAAGDDALAQWSADGVLHHPLTTYIVNYASKQMGQNNWMPLPSSASSLTLKRHEYHLHPSLESRRELAGRVLFRPRMWEMVDLPDSLFFLYPFVNPVEWAFFHATKFYASKSHATRSVRGDDKK